MKMNERKILENLNIENYRVLKMNDTFKFECTACGKCCFNNVVMLNCYDMVRLRNGLRSSTTKILQERLLSFSIGPSSGLPVCTLQFQHLSSETSKCPFLSPAIRKSKLNSRSKSEMKRVLATGTKIEKWLCSVHKNRPLACRFYPCGRIKNVDEKTNKIEETFFLQELSEFCPGFKKNKKQTLKKYLKDSEFGNYDKGSISFASLMKKIAEAGFFIPTKDNDKKRAVLKANSKIFFILGNIMYNFDSFNYFSNDERVLKTINDPNATQDDFMYVTNKIEALVSRLIKLFKDHDQDEDVVFELINKLK